MTNTIQNQNESPNVAEFSCDQTHRHRYKDWMWDNMLIINGKIITSGVAGGAAAGYFLVKPMAGAVVGAAIGGGVGFSGGMLYSHFAPETTYGLDPYDVEYNHLKNEAPLVGLMIGVGVGGIMGFVTGCLLDLEPVSSTVGAVVGGIVGGIAALTFVSPTLSTTLLEFGEFQDEQCQDRIASKNSS